MRNLQIHNAKCKLLHRCAMLVCLVSFLFSGESRECPLRLSLPKLCSIGMFSSEKYYIPFQINFRDVPFSI